MNSIINAASKVLRLQDDVKKATIILGDILILQPINHEVEPDVENLVQHELTKIIQGYPIQDNMIINSKKAQLKMTYANSITIPVLHFRKALIYAMIAEIST